KHSSGCFSRREFMEDHPTGPSGGNKKLLVCQTDHHVLRIRNGVQVALIPVLFFVLIFGPDLRGHFRP
ncbi:MAG: hypothetical protein ACKV2V_02800, partial [Blastocatellia bacterium]